jgi:mono/diheme cytochrome c family protein
MNHRTTLFAAMALSVTAWTSLNAADIKESYDKSCAACHGKDGAGATPMGKKLQIRDFTDAKVQASMKDADMIKAIMEGVKEGDKSRMKGYGDKLTAEETKSLVAYIRSLKK